VVGASLLANAAHRAANIASSLLQLAARACKASSVGKGSGKRAPSCRSQLAGEGPNTEPSISRASSLLQVQCPPRPRRVGWITAQPDPPAGTSVAAKVGAVENASRFSTLRVAGRFVGWMSLFTSTVTPLGGSMKSDPPYACLKFSAAI